MLEFTNARDGSLVLVAHDQVLAAFALPNGDTFVQVERGDVPCVTETPAEVREEIDKAKVWLRGQQQ